MSKSLTLDGATVTQVRLTRDMLGNLRVYAEYQLFAGSTLVESKHVDVTAAAGAAQLTAAQALFAAIGQAVAAAELG